MFSAPTPSGSAFTPARFSECLLEAVAADRRRDDRDRVQHMLLLRPYAGGKVDEATFEANLADVCARNAELAEVACEILTLWRLCSNRPATVGQRSAVRRELAPTAA